jgi:hypothetical protein
MTELDIIEDGTRIGYVNIDTGEWTHDATDPFVKGLLNGLLRNGDPVNIEANLGDAPLPENRVTVSIQSGEAIRFDIED